MRPMLILSIVSLAALSGCVAGDFCAVVKGPLNFTHETAAAVVASDRRTAEAIAVQNTYGQAHCDGW